MLIKDIRPFSSLSTQPPQPPSACLNEQKALITSSAGDTQKKIADIRNSSSSNDTRLDLTKLSPSAQLPERELKELSVSSLRSSIEKKRHPAGFRHFPTRKNKEINKTLRSNWSVFGTLGLFIFLGSLSIIIIPGTLRFEENIKARATSGFRALEETTLAENWADIRTAGSLIEQARGNFAQAQEELAYVRQMVHGWNNSLLDSAHAATLIEAGDRIAQAGLTGIRLAESFGKLKEQYMQNGWSGVQTAYPDLTGFLKEKLADIEQVQTYITQASAQLKEIPEIAVPRELRNKFNDARQKLETLSVLLGEIRSHGTLLLRAFGQDSPQRYAILLQNNDEMRPTGGFIGSILFVTFSKGYISQWQFQDVYQLDGQIHSVLPAPYGLNRIANTFSLRDANYWADFPTSARTILEFIQQGHGPYVDGVLVINQDLLLQMLQITGPVHVEGIKIPFSADNFSILMSYIVESKLYKDQPKEILKQFIDEFLKKLPTSDTAKLAEVLLENAEKRNIAWYAINQDLEAESVKLGLDGSLAASREKEDYFLLSETSLSGNKSDRYMQNRVEHETFISRYGHVTNRVTVAREHTFSQSAEEIMSDSIKKAGFELPDHMKTILGKGENVSYLRIYTPKGSQLNSVSGISRDEVTVSQENDKTVFGFIVRTYPGNTRNVTLEYQLPFQLTERLDIYKILTEKQIGGDTFAFEKKILLDEDLIFKKTSDGDTQNEKALDRKSELTNQSFFSALIENSL